MKILHVANELNHGDGVTNQLYILLSEIRKKKNIESVICCGGGDAAEKFREQGIEVIVSKDLNHEYRSLKNYAAAILKINGLIRNMAADIVHSHSHYAANISSQAVKLTGAKTIQTIHGLIPDTGRLKHFIAGHYVAVSRHVFEHLPDNTDTKDHSVLIHNGVEVNEHFEKKQNEKLQFISASALRKGKGIDTFIKAVSLLPQNVRSECTFMIAGRGELEKDLIKINADLNAGVQFLGLRKDILNVLEETDVLIMTSESEGLPMSVLEAGSRKNLIITSSYKGADELTDHGSDGLIFETGNASDLKEKILFAFENRKFITDASEKFFNKIKLKYGSKEMAERYVELYKQILKA